MTRLMVQLFLVASVVAVAAMMVLAAMDKARAVMAASGL
jgi:hypothetical protein